MKKKKRHYTTLGVAAVGATALTASLSTYHSLIAQAAELGYDNTLKFTTKSISTQIESTQEKKSHKPMDLIIVVDHTPSSISAHSGYNRAIASLVKNELTDEDRIIFFFYDDKNTTSSFVARKSNDSNLYNATKRLTRKQVLEVFDKPVIPGASNPYWFSNELRFSNLQDVPYDNVDTVRQYGDQWGVYAFEDVYKSFKEKNPILSVLQFTDGWADGSENIDTSFANWAKSNAKTFMSVLYGVGISEPFA